jgi:hypothetical protein
VYYRGFEPHDLSRWLLDALWEEMQRQWDAVLRRPLDAWGPAQRSRLHQRSAEFLADVRRRYGVENENHIKPGIGETTRVLLRRIPERLLLRQAGLPETEHLEHLARDKEVAITLDPGLPYRAAALIQELPHPCSS